MSTIDYDIFYREQLSIENYPINSAPFDIFISAFNASDRVKEVFDKIDSCQKYWLIHPEYRFSDDELRAQIIPSEILPSLEFLYERLVLDGDAQENWQAALIGLGLSLVEVQEI